MSARRWIKPIAIIGALWNGVGIASYLGDVGAFGPATASAAMPAVVTAAYATSVFAGAAGAIGLALLRAWAPALLWISLVAVVVNWSWVFRYSSDAEVPLGAAVLIIALVLVGLAEFARRQGWLQRQAPR